MTASYKGFTVTLEDDFFIASRDGSVHFEEHSMVTIFAKIDAKVAEDNTINEREELATSNPERFADMVRGA